MPAGQIISRYEPSMAIEGDAKSEKYEDTIILKQVDAIRMLLNVIMYNRFKHIFVNSVIVLDTLLILKGKDKEYNDKKKELERKYGIKGDKIENISDTHVKFGMDLFKEQLSFLNRKMMTDTFGVLEIDEKMLEEQKQLT